MSPAKLTEACVAACKTNCFRFGLMSKDGEGGLNIENKPGFVLSGATRGELRGVGLFWAWLVITLLLTKVFVREKGWQHNKNKLPKIKILNIYVSRPLSYLRETTSVGR